MQNQTQQAVLENLREFSTPDRPVYLVGGGVRDVLLGRPVHDLDFALPGETRKLANELACRLNGALYVLDEERDTTRVVLDLKQQNRMMIDFASLRGSDLETDLRRRDFTINAMAFDVAQPNKLIDPLGGLADLREKRIRAASAESLRSDPVRILRAVRQALSFQFRIEPQTLQYMREAAPLLPQISPERQRDELFRMFDGQQVALAMRVLDQVGALDYVLPELQALKDVAQTAPHVQNVWEHTISMLQHLEQLYSVLVGAYQEEKVADLTVGSAVLWLGRFRERFSEHYRQELVNGRSVRALLFLAALYHDISKPGTRTVNAQGRARFLGHEEEGAKIAARRARALALSVPEIDRLDKIVANHMRVHHLATHTLKVSGGDGERRPTRRSIYRFFKDTRQAGVDICLLSLADMRATYEFTLPQEAWEVELETCRAILEAYWEKSEAVVSPPRLLSGSDLLREFKLQPGKIVGRLLDAIREAQAADEIHDQVEAFAFARRWLARVSAFEEASGGDAAGSAEE